MAQEVFNTIEEECSQRWNSMMFDKPGILHAENEDKVLMDDPMALLTRHRPDYTNFFVSLEREVKAKEDIYISEELWLWHMK